MLRQSQAVAVVAAGLVRGIDHAAAMDEISGELADLRLEVATERSAGPPTVPLDAVSLDADDEPACRSRHRATTADVTAPATISPRRHGRQPKGVVLEHDMLLRSAYGSALTRAFEDGRRILFALPLQHVFGYVEGLLASMFAGGAVILQEAFDPHATLAAVERHRANEALFVPTMSLVVVEAARETDHDLSSLHGHVRSVLRARPPLGALASDWAHAAGDRLRDDGDVRGHDVHAPRDRVDLLVETVGRPKLGGVGGPLAEYRTGSQQRRPPPTARPAASIGRSCARPPRRRRETGARDRCAQATSAGSASTATRLTGRSKDLYRCRIGDDDADRGTSPG